MIFGNLCQLHGIMLCNIRPNDLLQYVLYYTILYYTILYYTILYYTILYYTILYYTILYYPILYYTILSYTILYYIIRECNIIHPYHICQGRSSWTTGAPARVTALPSSAPWPSRRGGLGSGSFGFGSCGVYGRRGKGERERWLCDMI